MPEPELCRICLDEAHGEASCQTCDDRAQVGEYAPCQSEVIHPDDCALHDLPGEHAYVSAAVWARRLEAAREFNERLRIVREVAAR